VTRTDRHESIRYEAALARLPETYAQALRYLDSGATEGDICSKLGIELEALEPLLDIARRKLRSELTRV
jgi:DNA-directed RNA polymerase specialized sigma24 family protein